MLQGLQGQQLLGRTRLFEDKLVSGRRAHMPRTLGAKTATNKQEDVVQRHFLLALYQSTRPFLSQP